MQLPTCPQTLTRRSRARSKNPNKPERPEALARLSYSSRSVYLGNLAFVTTDAQVHALFSRCGPLENVIMGLNKVTRAPCGFAYVIFRTREGAVSAVATLNGTVLDERVVKVELDKGFFEGKQYGRGESGGQRRDEMRSGYDEGRGGEGKGLSPLTSGRGGGRGGRGGAHRGRFEGGGERQSFGGPAGASARYSGDRSGKRRREEEEEVGAGGAPDAAAGGGAQDADEENFRRVRRREDGIE
jgi:nuclear cap-binding protein subunit 2